MSLCVNLPPDKMSGKSKVLPDKTDFLLFRPNKCPMSGAISRLDIVFTYRDSYPRATSSLPSIKVPVRCLIRS